MTLTHPVWLLLLLPLVVAWLAWRPASRWVWGLRVVSLALIVLALSGLSTERRQQAGVVVVVADRSLSMPANHDSRQLSLVALMQRSMGPHDRLGVVSFGREASIEQTPQRASFAGFQQLVDKDGSNLHQALQLALAMIPEGVPGRVLVLSDGRWTGKDPSTMASAARARNIAIDVYPMQRQATNDVAISALHAPDTVAPGEAFMMSAWIRVPVKQRIRYVLLRGKVPVAMGEKVLKAGRNRLLFRDRAERRGVLSYTLKVGGKGKDPFPENNKTRFLVGVRGPRPVLHVTTAKRSQLGRVLRSGKVSVVSKRPASLKWTLEELSRYSSVILENIPSQMIGRRGMQNVAAWVKNTGAGLMMTGGQRSFGVGGYIRSPLEPLLPVSMRLKQEHRKMMLALAIVLDRSCSMGASVAGGKTKMDLANAASVQALDLLGPLDELAVLAVDTMSHTVVPLSRIRDKDALRQKILSIGAMGGGIYVHDGLEAAYRVLSGAQAKTRHIILFSDASDSERPGRYREILKDCLKAGMTVSVIGLGSKGDSDAALLIDVAKRGKGRIFFTQDAQELPRLFAQDTMVVTRSSFVRDPAAIRFLPGWRALSQLSLPTPPPIGGYNLAYTRAGATIGAAIVSPKRHLPLVASWQVGLGRALAYLGEVDGRYTGRFGQWKHVGDMLSSLVRWTAGHHQRLQAPMTLSQKVEHGHGVITLKLDPETHHAWLSTRPKVRVLKGQPGKQPTVSTVSMRWVAPHQLAVRVPLRGKETAVGTVLLPGKKPISLAPMLLPYSPEFQPSTSQGTQTDLASLASLTKGLARSDVSGIWRALPLFAMQTSLAPWLLCLVVLLLLVEILERRAEWVSGSWVWLVGWRGRRAAARQDKPDGVVPTKVAKSTVVHTRKAEPQVQKTPRVVQEPKAKEPQEAKPANAVQKGTDVVEKTGDSKESSGMVGALRQASGRARKRTTRRE